MFNWIAGVIATLGYAGVAMLALLEHLFPPIPSELILPLAGYVAGSGDLAVAVVIATATAGSLAGSTLWYAIGRKVGERRLRAWIDRHGRWLTLSEGDVDRATAWFHRRGKIAVLIGRLLPGVRTFVSLPAGFTRMPWTTFLAFSAAGTLAWTAALVYAGLILKSNFEMVSERIDLATNIVFAILGALLVRRYVRCWRHRKHDPAAA